VKLFAEKLLPPGSGAARCRPPGVYSCKFQKQKYIFINNEIEKYKNKKSTKPGQQRWAGARRPFSLGTYCASNPELGQIRAYYLFSDPPRP